MKKMAQRLALIGWGCAACVALAAPAQVIDINSQPPQNMATTPSATEGGARTYGAAQTASGSTNGAGETAGGSAFLQIQQLRDEVANLRGQLEEQSHTIDNLSKQQMELERRMSSGSSSASAGANVMSQSPSYTQPSSASNSDGAAEFNEAFGLLKAKEYDKASTGFQGVINKYPASDYAGTSWFWLGFVYLTKGDLDGSAKAFSSLIERFPAHNKVDDAKYNLGKVYNQQGKTEQARKLLKEVAAGNSKSAPLAKSYLESM